MIELWYKNRRHRRTRRPVLRHLQSLCQRLSHWIQKYSNYTTGSLVWRNLLPPFGIASSRNRKNTNSRAVSFNGLTLALLLLIINNKERREIAAHLLTIYQVGLTFKGILMCKERRGRHFRIVRRESKYISSLTVKPPLVGTLWLQTNK